MLVSRANKTFCLSKVTVSGLSKDLNLSKESAQLMGFRLHKHNLLDIGTANETKSLDIF